LQNAHCQRGNELCILRRRNFVYNLCGMCKTITNIRITSLISLDYKFFKTPGLPVILAGKKEKHLPQTDGLTYKI
jgi:hypothetical protein